MSRGFVVVARAQCDAHGRLMEISCMQLVLKVVVMGGVVCSWLAVFVSKAFRMDGFTSMCHVDDSRGKAEKQTSDLTIVVPWTRVRTNLIITAISREIASHECWMVRKQGPPGGPNSGAAWRSQNPHGKR